MTSTKKLANAALRAAARVMADAGVGFHVGASDAGCYELNSRDVVAYTFDPLGYEARKLGLPRTRLVQFRKRNAERFRCLGVTTAGRRCRVPAVPGQILLISEYDPATHDYCRAHRTR